MSIQKTREKIKLFVMSENGERVILLVIILLVSLSSFYLGRATGTLKPQNEPVFSIETPKEEGEENSVLELNENEENLDYENSIIASKNGSKYYFPSCSGRGRILPENIISFSSEGEAQALGYQKSSTCKNI